MRDMIEFPEAAKNFAEALGWSFKDSSDHAEELQELRNSSTDIHDFITKIWNSDMRDMVCAVALFSVGFNEGMKLKGGLDPKIIGALENIREATGVKNG